MFHTEYDICNRSREWNLKGSLRNGRHSSFHWCSNDLNRRKFDGIGNLNRGQILKDNLYIARYMPGIRMDISL
jgi:hypothetical protein